MTIMAKLPTVGVGTIADVYYTLVKHGMSEPELTKLCSETTLDITNPDARVNSSCVPLLWDALIELTGNPAVGLDVGQQVFPERLSIVAQAFIQSDTLEQGIQQYIRFCQLVNESICVNLECKQGFASLRFSFDGSSQHQSEIERTVVSAVARARFILGDHFVPRKVTFQHSAPAYSSAYDRFFCAQVLFDQAHTGIIFSEKLLTLRQPKRNPYLFRVLTHHAEQLLYRIQSSQSTTASVKRIIKENLSNEHLDVEHVAKQLNMSRHTLYRRLKADEVSFQSLIENSRKEAAFGLLKQATLSISEVAFLTGFSELSAFSRAFKRWAGLSPAAFRKQNTAR